MLVGVVPVKELRGAKTRMAARLDPDQRADLCLAMLRDVLAVLRQSPGVDAILVTSPDLRVMSEAVAGGAVAMVDSAGSLNGAVAVALRTAAGMGATAALVLPGDIPLVSPADIAALVAALPPGDGVVAAPTWDGGTGALLLRPPVAIEPAYGPGSFRRHLAIARRAGLSVATRLLPNLAMDLDRPEELDRFLQTQTATHTGEFLTGLYVTRQGDHGCM